ncbi:hypothetical protein VCHA51O444_10246 [Vibrio chagasii]|nr:hypothetical protein VCHA51O444_10246 [Vibrio chagasii]
MVIFRMLVVLFEFKSVVIVKIKNYPHANFQIEPKKNTLRICGLI